MNSRLSDKRLWFATALSVVSERLHQVGFKIGRKLLLHGASDIETVGGIEGGLPRNGPHPLADHVCLHRFVIRFIHQDREGIARLRNFRRNRFVFGEGWLAPDSGIV